MGTQVGEKAKELKQWALGALYQENWGNQEESAEENEKEQLVR